MQLLSQVVTRILTSANKTKRPFRKKPR